MVSVPPLTASVPFTACTDPVVNVADAPESTLRVPPFVNEPPVSVIAAPLPNVTCVDGPDVPVLMVKSRNEIVEVCRFTCTPEPIVTQSPVACPGHVPAGGVGDHGAVFQLCVMPVDVSE